MGFMKIAFFLFVFGIFAYLFYSGYFSLPTVSNQSSQTEIETNAREMPPEDIRLESDILNTMNRIQNK